MVGHFVWLSFIIIKQRLEMVFKLHKNDDWIR